MKSVISIHSRIRMTQNVSGSHGVGGRLHKLTGDSDIFLHGVISLG